MQIDESLQLLLAHGDGTPVLREGFDAAALRGESGDASEGPDHLWEEGDDPNLLPSQRWGVLAPQGPVGDRLLALVRPLIERRAQQQGAEVEVYRVPPRLSAVDAVRWRRKVFEGAGGLRVELPRYQLLLGDFDVMPLALQDALALDGYPGRLAFAEEEGYESYVSKVLRWETGAKIAAAEALLCGVRDGTSATELAHSGLVRPGLGLLQKAWESGYLQTAGLSEVATGEDDEPSPEGLLARAAGARSAVLLSASHGEGAPPRGWADAATQRARQGAMCFGRAGSLTGAELRTRPFMPGGVWCMLACYSAGTPEQSAYRHWLERLQQAGRYMGRASAVLAGLPRAGEPPFVAALPQAALANPEGPLAFVGHVDLAWTYGFQELDGRSVSRPGRLMAMVRNALRGDRIGVGLREVARGVGMANAELTSLFDQDASAMAAEAGDSDAARRAHLWLLRQDLAGYVLLGDPAVRLALEVDEPPLEEFARPDEVRAQAGIGPEEAEADPLARHEALIGRALAGEDVGRIAAGAGVAETSLRAALEVYREAGRAALRRHLAGS